MSTRVEGGTVLIMITAQATLSARPVRLSLSAHKDLVPGTWRDNLADPTNKRANYGRVAGMAGHMDALRYAVCVCVCVCVCAAGYEPGTTERGLLEQFAETGEHQRAHLRGNDEQ